MIGSGGCIDAHQYCSYITALLRLWRGVMSSAQDGSTRIQNILIFMLTGTGELLSFLLMEWIKHCRFWRVIVWESTNLWGWLSILSVSGMRQVIWSNTGHVVFSGYGFFGAATDLFLLRYVTVLTHKFSLLNAVSQNKFHHLHWQERYFRVNNANEVAIECIYLFEQFWLSDPWHCWKVRAKQHIHPSKVVFVFPLELICRTHWNSMNKNRIQNQQNIIGIINCVGSIFFLSKHAAMGILLDLSSPSSQCCVFPLVSPVEILSLTV